MSPHLIRSAAIALALLFAFGPGAGQSQPPPAVEEENYELTDAEADAVIDEAIGEDAQDGEAVTDAEAEDPTILPVYAAKVAEPLEDLASSTLLDEALAEQEAEPVPATPAAVSAADAGVAAAAQVPEPAPALAPGDTYKDESDPATRCEFFGSDPIDPDRLQFDAGEPVTDAALDTRYLMKSCGADVTPSTVKIDGARRQGYIRARALWMMGESDHAMVQFEVLCAADYGAACYQLARANADGTGARRDRRAALSYARKSARLGVAVGGEMARLLESEDWLPSTKMPGLHDAILAGRLDTIPQTMATQRVVITLFTRMSEGWAMWKKDPFSLDDHRNALSLRVPVVVERAKSVGTKVPALPFGVAAPSLEMWITEMMKAGTTWVMLPKRVTAVEVTPAVEDATLIMAAFDAQPTSSDRQTYLRNLSRLMAQWAPLTPGPDSAQVCRLFRADLRTGCLPLPEYNIGDPVQEIGAQLGAPR